MIRRTPSRARAARRLVPLAAAAVALGLTGCQTQSPIQTDLPYQPADGVAVDLDQVQVRNLVLVSDSKGGPGTISAAVVNSGSKDATVTFAAEGGASAEVQVPAFGEKQVSQGSPVSLPSVSAGPGAVAVLQVSTPDSGANIVHVPVMAAQGYYETLAPSASSSASSSASPSASPTTTATP